jgi:hypothetical protein
MAAMAALTKMAAMATMAAVWSSTSICDYG